MFSQESTVNFYNRKTHSLKLQYRANLSQIPAILELHLNLPFRVFLRFSFVRCSIDLTVCMYRVLFLPAIQVVIPGDFIWLLEQKTRVKRIKSGIIDAHVEQSENIQRVQ